MALAHASVVTRRAYRIIVDGAPQVLPVEGGELTLPSVVAYKPDGRILVGRAAQRYALSHPSSVLSSTKRLMGKTWEAANSEAGAGATLPHPALTDVDGWAGFRLPSAPPTMPPAVASEVRLSSCPAVDVAVPGVEARFRLTTQAFDSMTRHLYRRARETLDKACWQVLLVGGATRMPGLRRFVKNMTGLEAEEQAVDPDLAVAAGAAICAGMRDGSMGDLMVMDVWQAALMRALAAKNVL
ncbi:Chaperone protein dnaK [Auxenochlorella protothecoides]|uniref:Chaperone protein dnaK n=1 Tax=Auxenochlorella protothecoides TaxID=3075 RepID=A0A087SN74_AUXPR|nr:Chaperone protein dnaK [Auxenochlorella protothecoides]KFM27178.1 Chaperone protein dnaK [Auxenochlorella protothecoides]